MSWAVVRPEESGFGAEWQLAGELLARVLPRRWSHSQGVCYRAVSIGSHVAPSDEVLLARAAILHDIGYSPAIAQTGFHPLDGATYLRSLGMDERVVGLVAHHSCAHIEADLRGLGAELGAFAPGPAHMTDAMVFCDMTVSPDGLPVSVEARISEVLKRYGPDSVVGRFIQRAAPELRAASSRVQHALELRGMRSTTEGDQ